MTEDVALRGFDDDEWLGHLARATEELELGTLAGYRLHRVIARGAQGTVYEAFEPRTGRRVAIKRLPSAQPSERESARFALETAALTSLTALSHPNIVRLLSAPEVDHARLLIMDWVDGAPLDAWSDAVWAEHTKRDAVRVVVACLSKAASAMTVAHALGLVHRDLKPSNVLVSKAGEPTVLDFGIARSDALETRLTQTDGFAGTPAWAAPEQIAPVREGAGAGSGAGPTATLSAPPDARVDVHGLGLLLYRALAGRTAIDTSLPLGPLCAAISGPMPSAPSAVRAGLPRELDAVALKALAKDPAHRYQSADALHQDLERYLRGEPVQAQPPRVTTLLRTLVRRHRLAAAALAVACVALVAGTAFSVMFALDAGAARVEATQRADHAVRATARAERMNDFFRGLLSRVREREAAGAQVSAGDIVAMAAAGLMTDGLDDESQFSLHETLGVAFYEIGDYEASADQYGLAIATLAGAQELQDSLPDAEAERGRLLVKQARSLQRASDPKAAAACAVAAVSAFGTASGTLADRAAAFEVLAMSQVQLGSLDEARTAADAAVALAEKAGDPIQLAMGLTTDSLLLHAEGRLPLAAERAIAAAQVMANVEGASVAERARVLHNAGAMCGANARYEESLAYLRQSLALREAEFAPGHPILITARSSIASVHRALGQHDESVAIMEHALAQFTARHPGPGVERSNLQRGVAFALEGRGTAQDLQRAAVLARASLEGFAHGDYATGPRASSAARLWLRAVGTHQGAAAARALALSMPSLVPEYASDEMRTAWLHAVLLRELIIAPPAWRAPIDAELIGLLRNNANQPALLARASSLEALEASLVLAEALARSGDVQLREEARQLAERLLPDIERQHGRLSPTTKRAQAAAAAAAAPTPAPAPAMP